MLADDVLLVLDGDSDLTGRGLMGHTWPDGVQITLYPDAFSDEEQLLRTAVHQLVHVRQVRESGPPRDTLELVRREREAYAEEENMVAIASRAALMGDETHDAWVGVFLAITEPPVDPKRAACPNCGRFSVRFEYLADRSSRVGLCALWCENCRHGHALLEARARR